MQVLINPLQSDWIKYFHINIFLGGVLGFQLAIGGIQQAHCILRPFVYLPIIMSVAQGIAGGRVRKSFGKMVADRERSSMRDSRF